MVVSHEENNIGYRFLTSYKQLNTNMSFDYSSQKYTNLNENNLSNKNRYRGNLSFNYNTPSLGGLSLSYRENSSWDNIMSQQLSLSYNKQLGSSGIFFSLGINHSLTDNVGDSMFLTLRYLPKNKKFYNNLNYNIKSQENIEQTVSLQKDFPRAKGYGYNAKLSHKNDKAKITGQVQYRNEKGIYTGKYTYSDGNTDTTRLSYAGSLAFIDGNFHIGRPIYDSFSLVQVAGLDNVGILSNGTLVGNTDDSGKLLVSELNSYQENRLAIQTKNMPLNYNLEQREQFIQVKQRSGSLVSFEITKFTAVEGNIQSSDGKALELFPLEIEINGKTQESFTGNDGYFYLEKIPVGEHDLRVLNYGESCIAKLKVPETEKIVVSLGTLVCE